MTNHNIGSNVGSNTRSNSIANVIRAVVIIAWVLGVVWLLEDDRYRWFIRTELWPLLLAALVMLMLFAYPVLLRRKVTSTGGTTLQRLATAGIMLLPLVYLVSAPASGLDSYAFTKRLTDHSWAFTGEFSRQGGNIDSATNSPDSPIDLSLVELGGDISKADGLLVRLTGRTYRDADTPSGSLVLFRFVIVCCAADSRPTAIRVDYPGADTVANDSWVEVTGRLRTTSEGDESVVRIEADSIRPIPPPENPYLYFETDR